MPKKERYVFVQPNPDISVVRQCALLGISRASHYYAPKPESGLNISLMNRVDEIYTRQPYLGAVKITEKLNRTLEENVNHKRIERLMSLMGIQAIRPKKNLSKNAKKHPKYPYLLNKLVINHPNQVWGTDITYIRANGQWFYLVAILDWYSRFVVSWKLSRSLESDFCQTCLREALKIAIPEIHNSDQGVQFTAEEYLAILKAYESIRISMDGRGRCFDNIFTERLWRSVKYEEVYLKEYRSFREAEISLAQYFFDYNFERPHESLDYQMPSEAYFGLDLYEQKKNEAAGAILRAETEAGRFLIPGMPKIFTPIISNNPKVEISHI